MLQFRGLFPCSPIAWEGPSPPVVLPPGAYGALPVLVRPILIPPFFEHLSLPRQSPPGAVLDLEVHPYILGRPSQMYPQGWVFPIQADGWTQPPG